MLKVNEIHLLICEVDAMANDLTDRLSQGEEVHANGMANLFHRKLLALKTQMTLRGHVNTATALPFQGDHCWYQSREYGSEMIFESKNHPAFPRRTTVELAYHPSAN